MKLRRLKGETLRSYNLWQTAKPLPFKSLDARSHPTRTGCSSWSSNHCRRRYHKRSKSASRTIQTRIVSLSGFDSRAENPKKQRKVWRGGKRAQNTTWVVFDPGNSAIRCIHRDPTLAAARVVGRELTPGRRLPRTAAPLVQGGGEFGDGGTEPLPHNLTDGVIAQVLTNPLRLPKLNRRAGSAAPSVGITQCCSSRAT